MADTPPPPSLMDDHAFLEELARLDAKPPAARPRHVSDDHVARLERNMPAVAPGAPAPAAGRDVPSALLPEFDEDDAAIANVDAEARGLGPVLVLGLAAGAAAAAFVLHERLAWIVSRVW